MPRNHQIKTPELVKYNLLDLDLGPKGKRRGGKAVSPSRRLRVAPGGVAGGGQA